MQAVGLGIEGDAIGRLNLPNQIGELLLRRDHVCEADFADAIFLTAIRSRAIRRSFSSRASYR